MIKIEIRQLVGMATQRFDIEHVTHTDGAIKTRLPPEAVALLRSYTDNPMVRLTPRLNDSDDIMAFFLTIDAIRQVSPDVGIQAVIGYLPYARQDRVCNVGEPFSLAVFAKMLNAQNLTAVHLIDPHSQVAEDLINEAIVHDQGKVISECFGEVFACTPITRPAPMVLLAPDKGAVAKISLVAQALKAKLDVDFHIHYASKKRNPETMEIEGIELDAPIPADAHVFIIDDICDGGRTFIELAKAVRQFAPATMTLMVTHGLFSYGTEVVGEYFDNIYTTNSLMQGNRNLSGYGQTKFNFVQVDVFQYL